MMHSLNLNQSLALDLVLYPGLKCAAECWWASFYVVLNELWLLHSAQQ